MRRPAADELADGDDVDGAGGDSFYFAQNKLLPRQNVL